MLGHKLHAAVKASTQMSFCLSWPLPQTAQIHMVYFISAICLWKSKVYTSAKVNLEIQSLISERASCVTREDKTCELPSSNTAGGIDAGIGCTRQSPVTNTCSPSTWVLHLNHCSKSIVKQHGPDSLLHFARVKWHQNKGLVLKAKTDFMIIRLFFICMHMYT